jgi:predicted DCC family thiol-disulfide oxidoreductase YuxK
VNDSSDPIAVSAGHYSLIRILMGAYLCLHFVMLIPYGAELFSAQGLLAAELSPLLGIIPNPLAEFDSPLMVSGLLACGAMGGLFIAFGAFDRVSAVLVAIILGWLFARNPLIANPSLPVVGWMLLAHACLPGGAYGAWSARGNPDKWTRWYYPRQIWIAAWVMLAVAYSYSGYTKMLSPSWVDGSAIGLVLENPLARDHFLRSLLLDLPPIFLQLLTWTVLVVELLFVVLCLWGPTRKWAWLAMFAIQFGFLTFLNFADLTFPMLLIHLLTFDRRWLRPLVAGRPAILFYDGDCAFCNGLVRFAMSEDTDRSLRFAPLQGESFRQRGLTPGGDDSIVLLSDEGETRYKSDAAIYVLKSLGGIWAALGVLIASLPKSWRDRCYDRVGRLRYRLAGRIDHSSCRLLPPSYAQRQLP